MIKFTAHEVRDILISMTVIAAIFAYIFSIGSSNVIENVIYLIPATFIAAGLGFVLHELAHKFVAIRYGFRAEFRMWVQGLILAIVMAAFGFVFAAPGAVYIQGEYISREENGKISIAGPLTNMVLAVFFLALMPLVSTSPADLLSYEISNIILLGFAINSFLAFFNLIPVAILDGAKVLKWNPVIWGIVTVFALILTVKAFLTMRIIGM
ncbi:site-2 protease family protein [Methanobacterium aggregans]|uniref:site-2 protease family protein n=1 Tax=Methanobacterium aggregans TaxID=1615586 RepID=UPI001AE4B219|nr:site-2 protease family protein [Methanobacterium aggregans]MBP2046170.1 Zn-dependent protease [Methanobacterium aggregans]